MSESKGEGEAVPTALKSAYTLSRRMPDGVTVDQAVERLTASMKKQKFGLPPGTTNMKAGEIFVKKGLATEVQPYRLIGYCSPPEAFKVLKTEPSAGVFLPCTALIMQTDDGHVEIAVQDPLTMLGIISKKDELLDTIHAVRRRVLTAINEA